jgi:hypothetical protein
VRLGQQRRLVRLEQGEGRDFQALATPPNAGARSGRGPRATTASQLPIASLQLRAGERIRVDICKGIFIISHQIHFRAQSSKCVYFGTEGVVLVSERRPFPLACLLKGKSACTGSGTPLNPHPTPHDPDGWSSLDVPLRWLGS